MRFKYLVLLLMLIVVYGCTTRGKNTLTATNRVPPRFVYFNSAKMMNSEILDTKKYTIKLPLAKDIDFKYRKGWYGMTI